MVKTTTEKQFDYLVSKIIWPHFKSIGYKKSGNNFRFFNDENKFGKIVSFQKSSYYDKDHIHFTVNIGLYLADFEYYHTGKYSAEKFIEPICAVRHRIGSLTNGDSWYDLDAEVNINMLQNKVESDIKNKVIPYLNKINSREDIIYQLIVEGSDYLIARIKTLYYNGHRQRALNILEQEYSVAADIMKQRLDELRQELNGNPNK